MNPSQAYLSQQLASLSPAKRVALLYDKAIASLRDAIQAIEAGDIERRWKSNKLACDVIETLWATLDVEQGGEIAQNLNRLYSFMLQHLPAVDFRNDPKPAEEVIALLEPLRQSWHELARRTETDAGGARPRAEAPQPAPAGGMERLVLSA